MSRNVLESRRWLSVCKSSKISAFVGRILIRTAATPAHILLRQHLRSRSLGAPKCIYERHEIFQTSSSRKTIVSPLFCLFVCFLSYRSRSPWSDDFFPRKRFRVDVKRGPRCRVNEKKRKRERETERNRFQTKARGRRVRSPRCEKKNRNKNHFRKRFCVLSFAFPLRPTFARRTFVSSTRLEIVSRIGVLLFLFMLPSRLLYSAYLFLCRDVQTLSGRFSPIFPLRVSAAIDMQGPSGGTFRSPSLSLVQSLSLSLAHTQSPR